ncbi:MAG: hypothetical protein ACP5NS_00845 [Candidatus Pacearchaeota archaeon]
MSLEGWALGISVLALSVAIAKDFVLPFIFKPKVRLEGLDDGECIENAVEMGGTRSRWIRIRAVNEKGFFSKTAKGCYIKVLRIKDSNGNKISPFESLPLPWVSYDDFSGGRYDLGVGEYHMIDLVHEYENERVLRLKIAMPIELRKQEKVKLKPGTYQVEVAIYGDNFRSEKKIFKVKLTKNFGELTFTK